MTHRPVGEASRIFATIVEPLRAAEAIRKGWDGAEGNMGLNPKN